MTEPGRSACSDGGRRAQRFLSPSQKYEIWIGLLRGEYSTVEAAERAGVDRSTIVKLRSVAKHGALDALAASRSGVRRGDHVDRQHLLPADNASVVDHRIHPSEAVHMVSDAACLPEVQQVPDDGPGAPIQEVAHGQEPIPVASMDDDLVPVLEQRPRSRLSETVSGAGDD